MSIMAGRALGCQNQPSVPCRAADFAESLPDAMARQRYATRVSDHPGRTGCAKATSRGGGFGWVLKKCTALVRTFTAFSVVNLLERHFSDLVDYAFTARMEDELDNIATGDEEVLPWLNRTSAPTGTGIRD